MAIPATNDYGYALALRRAARTPSSVAAIADVETPTWQYGAATGRRDADVAATVMNRDLQERKISEAARETNLTYGIKQADMARAQQMMDVWAEQNKWATAIGELNLGVTGFMNLGQIEEQKRRYEMQNRLVAAYEQIPLALKDAANRSAEFESEQRRRYLLGQ